MKIFLYGDFKFWFVFINDVETSLHDFDVYITFVCIIKKCIILIIFLLDYSINIRTVSLMKTDYLWSLKTYVVEACLRRDEAGEVLFVPSPSLISNLHIVKITMPVPKQWGGLSNQIYLEVKIEQLVPYKKSCSLLWTELYWRWQSISLYNTWS